MGLKEIKSKKEIHNNLCVEVSKKNIKITKKASKDKKLPKFIQHIVHNEMR